MPKSDTMKKLFWSIYNDLGAFEQLEIIEMMLHKWRHSVSKYANDSKAHEVT